MFGSIFECALEALISSFSLSQILLRSASGLPNPRAATIMARAQAQIGLCDRNSPICTLSQNGYGGKSSVPFFLFILNQKSSGMASQGLGSLQGASQDPGSICKIRLSADSVAFYLFPFPLPLDPSTFPLPFAYLDSFLMIGW